MAYNGQSATVAGVPVQIETPYGLTGAESPGGYGILAWKNGSASNEIHVAVLPDVGSFLVDDIVQAGDVRVALTFPVSDIFLCRPSLTCIGSDLLLCISRNNSAGEMTVDIYVANNADNPTSWSLRGNVQTASGGYTGLLGAVEEALATGTIFKMSSGRWVLQTGLWSEFQHNAFHRSGVWTSDNNGSTWTERLNLGYHQVGGSYLLYHSNQLAYDPISGDIFWYGLSGVTINDYTWHSTDGITWNFYQPDSKVALGFWDGGNRAWLMHALGSSVERLDGLPETTTTFGTWNVGRTVNDAARMSRRVLIAASGDIYFFFNDDTVSRAGGSGWFVGQIGMTGYTPGQQA